MFTMRRLVLFAVARLALAFAVALAVPLTRGGAHTTTTYVGPERR
jgi:hypothetical protein